MVKISGKQLRMFEAEIDHWSSVLVCEDVHQFETIWKNTILKQDSWWRSQMVDEIF